MRGHTIQNECFGAIAPVCFCAQKKSPDYLIKDKTCSAVSGRSIGHH